MLRKTLAMVLVVVAVGPVAQALAGSSCPGCSAVAAKGEGFCCGKGLAFGVKLVSKKLSEALAGMDVEADKVKCPGCKSAAKTGGVCRGCNVGIANGKAYHSMVAFKLAKGTPLSAGKKIACSNCKAAAKNQGFCTACNAGFVANRVFKSKDDYKAARAAHETLVKASETAKHCEACAVAMVTDGSCKACKASFKEGKRVTR